MLTRASHRPARPLIWLTLAVGLAACSDLSSQGSNVNVEKGYYSSVSLWPSLEIPVCWEDRAEVTELDRELIQQAVNETWAAAVPFEFQGWGQCEEGSEGIRIKVDDSNPRAYIGTAIDGVRNGMYLNVTFNNFGRACRRTEVDRRECVQLVAVHEFGHALGLDHEQERDDTPGWCRDREAKYGHGGDTEVGSWDLHSVMNYCNPEWAGNGELSDGDIETIRTAYRSLIEEQGEAAGECLALVSCQQGCEGDGSCKEGCAAESSERAQEGLQRLAACDELLKCNGDWGCLKRYCDEELQSCDPSLTELSSYDPRIFEPSEGLIGCLPLLNCVEDCFFDSCVQACFQSASGAAIEAYGDLTSCAQQAGCEDMSCSQTACPDEVSACLD